MATMKTKDATVRGSVSNIRINGIVYRLIRSPRSAENKDPVSLQTYFYDSEEQLQYQMKLCPQTPNMMEIENSILRSLHQIFKKNVPNSCPHSFLNSQDMMDKGTIPQNISKIIQTRREKTCFSHMRTTKVQISLRIRAVWSAPLLFAT